MFSRTDYGSFIALVRAHPLPPFGARHRSQSVHTKENARALFLTAPVPMQTLEKEKMGQRRAEQIEELLKGAGLTDINYELQWMDVTKLTNGVEDAARRIVEVIVK